MLKPTGLVSRILDRLDGVKSSGDGWAALCPAHLDSQPSLTVGVGKDGRVLLKCHRGCDLEEIVDRLDITVSDLYRKKAGDQKDNRPDREFVESYNYLDENGELVFQVSRWLLPDGRKTFTQRRPDGHGGWIYSLGNTVRPLYRLPRVLKAINAGEPIWVVEGEKDVHTLEELGLVATTNSGGANSWRPEHTKALSGASQVNVIADRDGPGRKHAAGLIRDLEAHGVDIRGLVPPDGNKDVSDLVETGGTIDDLEELDIEETPPDEFTEFLDAVKKVQNDGGEIGRKVAKARALLDRLELPEIETPARMVKWDEFIRESAGDDYEWIIPNTLERQERVIVVAAEGVGKSMLGRQVAMLSAAGLHPFRPDRRIDPIRTLYIDLENPEKIIRRTTRKIMERIRWAYNGQVPTFQAHLVPKPDGVDILKPADRSILEGWVAEANPDILFFGPVYKSFLETGGRSIESIVGEVARFLDYLRVTYDCAIWLEHHAPLGDSGSRMLRPFGSGVWSRWSEFGLAIYPDPTQEYIYDIRHYRGMRDKREWPKSMRRGNTWPFEVDEFYSM